MPQISSVQQICEELRRKIDTQELKPGDKLPSTRALASDLGVSRTSVVTVYEQLASEGYIETAVGARARVAMGFVPSGMPHPPFQNTPHSKRPKLSAYGQRAAKLPPHEPPPSKTGEINFLYGAIADSDFPKLIWRKTYNQVLMKRQDRLYYSLSEGVPELRSQLQGYLQRARGLSCSPDQIVVVQGTQQAIDLCARVLLDPGSQVLMEEPSYQIARRAFETLGAEIMPIPVDEHGLVTSDLPRVPGALAYVTPSHQFPLGSVMSIGRRRELLAWAAANRCWIVEDDYDSEFRYGLRPTPTLQSLDTDGAVIYVGTFSKALSPQLRLGYLVLPPALVVVFRQAKQLADRHAPWHEQMVIASFIQSGAYERHIRRLRRENEKRRALLIQALKAHMPMPVLIEGSATGLHIVVWLEELRISDEPVLVEHAKALGVGVWGVTRHYAAGKKFRQKKCAGLVMGYASLTPADIHKGVKVLAQAVGRTQMALHASKQESAQTIVAM